jgi:hypothetical protein
MMGMMKNPEKNMMQEMMKIMEDNPNDEGMMKGMMES